MASSRRTSPTQVNRKLEWTQPLVENNSTKNQNREHSEDREVGRRREISDITCRHLEQVINMMIPSSTCSSVDKIESGPVNSIVTQPSEKEADELVVKQAVRQKEKQVIVNNYYISDRERGWKQLAEIEILPSTSENTTREIFGKISPKTAVNTEENSLNIGQEVRASAKPTKKMEEIMEQKKYHSEEVEIQNMLPSPTHNFKYPPPVRPTGTSETSAMLDCIHQLQLTLQQHILTNSRQAEYHMPQNVNLFTEMIKVQNRRDLDLAIMAIPTFTGKEPKKCLDWISIIRNICSQAGHSLCQELMNKSEPVVQNFIRTMGDAWMDEEVVEEILKYF